MEDEAQYSRLLDERLSTLYASALVRNIETVSRKYCYGCEVQHPSQTKHSCVMWDTNNKLRAHFAELVDSVDVDELVQQWCKEVESLPLPPGYLELYKLKFTCEAWRNLELTSSEWRDKLYGCCLRLVQDL
jgi:hypothetical protein